jgi:hypothetical protein
VQIPDSNVKSRFLAVFARPERITACACERASEVTLPHTLHLIGDNITQKIRAADGRMAQLLKAKKTDQEVIDEIMILALGRLPKEQERQAFIIHMQSRAASRAEAFDDFMWAVLNTKEFLFNH